MTITTADYAPTETQLNTTHPYENNIARYTCWMFENIYTIFGNKFAPEYFDNLRHNLGQSALNGDRDKVAKAWAEFTASKLAEACATKAVELATAHARDEITANEAIGELVRFSNGHMRRGTAIRVLSKNLDNIAA